MVLRKSLGKEGGVKYVERLRGVVGVVQHCYIDQDGEVEFEMLYNAPVPILATGLLSVEVLILLMTLTWLLTQLIHSVFIHPLAEKTEIQNRVLKHTLNPSTPTATTFFSTLRPFHNPLPQRLNPSENFWTNLPHHLRNLLNTPTPSTPLHTKSSLLLSLDLTLTLLIGLLVPLCIFLPILRFVPISTETRRTLSFFWGAFVCAGGWRLGTRLVVVGFRIWGLGEDGEGRRRRREGGGVLGRMLEVGDDEGRRGDEGGVYFFVVGLPMLTVGVGPLWSPTGWGVSLMTQIVGLILAPLAGFVWWMAGVCMGRVQRGRRGLVVYPPDQPEVELRGLEDDGERGRTWLDERPWRNRDRWMVVQDGDIDEHMRIPDMIERERARERNRV
ncbi:hypothetical protein HDV05_006568 [Chytridiales sp. JEL 0842]|nr:hypothetical protein HDV05_006568 [Chytridiales sp. JEL 0842]